MLDGIRGGTVIHLASHAEYDSENVFESAVHLADGNLSVATLIGEWSGASLVVLSACEGAAGAITTGGEALGLSAALLRTGADSVVASLWRVDDAAIAYLMTLSHEHLASGLTPGGALRAAQVEVSTEPGWGDPYYWVGFLVAERGCALDV